MPKSLTDLREERTNALAALDDLNTSAITEDRDHTEAEEVRKVELLQIVESLNKKIGIEERLEAARIAAQKPTLPQPAPSPTPAPGPSMRDGVDHKPIWLKLRNLQAFKNETAAYRSGQFLLASLFGHDGARSYCMANGIDLRAQAGGVNKYGGFLVPVEMSQAIIDIRNQYGVFRQNVRVVPMSRDTMEIPRRLTGLTAYWTGEGVQITESDKTWDNVTLTAKKLAVLARMSSEIAEDAIISIADDLANEAGYSLAYSEDQAGFNGTGTSTYGGIRGVMTKIIDGTHTLAAVSAASGHDTMPEVDSADLTKAMGALHPMAFARGPAWYCSTAAKVAIFDRLLAAANGLPSLGNDVGARYLGYPIVVSESLPSDPAATINGTPILLFGRLDMAATLGDRREISIARSDDRYFEYDQIAIKATERIDINVHDLGTTAVQSPLVALLGLT